MLSPTYGYNDGSSQGIMTWQATDKKGELVYVNNDM